MHRTNTEQLVVMVLLCSLMFDNLRLVTPTWTVCKPCTGIECDANPPEYCPWGEARDLCRRRVCAKGPGERCGGSMSIYGECGEGMMCHSADERCHGCSLITLDCYRD